MLLYHTVVKPYGSVDGITGWIAMKFCTHIHCPQRINPNESGHPLTVYLAPPAGQSFYLSSEICHHPHDELGQYFQQAFIILSG